MIIPVRVAVQSDTLQMAMGAGEVNLPVTVSSTRFVPMELSASTETLLMGVGTEREDIPVKCVSQISQSDFPAYTGPFEFTPSSEEQIIPTHSTAFYRDIVINPVPSNYGLVTWNGQYITVS